MFVSRQPLERVAEGEPLSAEHQNRLIDLATRSVAGGTFFSTPAGTVLLPPPPSSFLSLEWYKLEANLDAGGTALADGYQWNSVGDGSYVGNDSRSNVTVKDLTGQHWGVAGEWILIRERVAHYGMVYEAMSHGAPRHQATLSADLYSGLSALASVNVNGTARAITVYDKFLLAGESIAAGETVGVAYDVHLGQWVVEQAEC